jgi:hypothetical protein
MHGQAVTLAAALMAVASPAAAQSDEQSDSSTEEQRTAEQFLETARELYSVSERESEPCPAPVGNEIVVCRQLEDADKQRLLSPTERAQAAGEMPPDPIPSAPDLWGGMRGGVTVAKGCFVPPCPRPMPPIIDFSKIPEALTPEEAALVFSAEDLPNREEASPAAAP